MEHVWVWLRNDDDGRPRGIFRTRDRAKDAVRSDFTEVFVSFDDSETRIRIFVTFNNGQRMETDNDIVRMTLDVDEWLRL